MRTLKQREAHHELQLAAMQEKYDKVVEFAAANAGAVQSVEEKYASDRLHMRETLQFAQEGVKTLQRGYESLKSSMGPDAMG